MTSASTSPMSFAIFTEAISVHTEGSVPPSTAVSSVPKSSSSAWISQSLLPVLNPLLISLIPSSPVYDPPTVSIPSKRPITSDSLVTSVPPSKRINVGVPLASASLPPTSVIPPAGSSTRFPSLDDILPRGIFQMSPMETLPYFPRLIHHADAQAMRRMGGDEFVVILGVTGLRLVIYAEEYRRRNAIFSRSNLTASPSIPPTSSTPPSTLPTTSTPPSTVVGASMAESRRLVLRKGSKKGKEFWPDPQEEREVVQATIQSLEEEISALKKKYEARLAELEQECVVRVQSA